ncbi:phage holin [Bacillaceae bacterium IKA-2]|nr:phage holin [Bacillaceae bacterium IKA-2]
MKMNKGTIVRTVVLAIALINQVLTIFGMSPLPLDEATINDIAVQVDLLVATLLTVFSALWSWWKDNDVTKGAIERKKKLGGDQ